jgi:glycosyltransferase involved in cell wall biosynthesis
VNLPAPAMLDARTASPPPASTAPTLRSLMVVLKYPPLGDGAERQAEALACRLIQRGISVTVLTGRFGSYPTHAWQHGVQVVRISFPERVPLFRQMPGAIVLAVRAAFYILRYRTQFDVVHCHVGGPLTAAGLLAARLAGVPSVLKIAASGGWSDFRLMRSGWYGVLGRALAPLLRLADVFVVLNEDAEAELTALVGRERVVRLPNGVDLPESRWEHGLVAQRRVEMGLAPDEDMVFAAGRLDRQKGFDILVQACAGSGGPLVVIAGEGNEQPALLAQAARVGTRLRLLGRIGGEQVDHWMRAASAVAVPSRAEGMSNTLLEALANGCPTVASAIPGNVDLIENGATGLLIPPEDADALRQRLDALRSDPALASSLSAAAYRQTVARFTIASVAIRYDELYRTIIKRESKQ